MAAGEENYIGKYLNYRKTTTTTIPVALINDTETALKDRFFLDTLLKVDSGFIGGTIEGSAYDNCHNKLRETSLKWHKGGVNNCQNDAGLNTYGYSRIESILTTFPNSVKLSSFFKSAYFLDSIGRGYEYSINNGAWLDISNTYPGFLKDTSFTSNDKLGVPAVFNDSVRLRSYIINDEGKGYSLPVEFFASEPLFSITFIKRASACSVEGDALEVFMLQTDYDALSTITEIDTETDIYGYKDDEFTETLDDGFYVEDSFATNYKSFLVAGGQFRRYVLCQTAPVTNRIYVFETGLTGIDACTFGDENNRVYRYLYYQGDLDVGTIMYIDEYLNNTASLDTFSDEIVYISVSIDGLVTQVGAC